MKPMKRKVKKRETFEELETLAHDTSDLKPLSPAMRRRWEAARRTGGQIRPGRPRKDPKLKSRIVPISMDPALLEEVDRYADAAGVTRSRLIAEALRLRMGT
jgi:Ribbon-helix-helix protein, copG family